LRTGTVAKICLEEAPLADEARSQRQIEAEHAEQL
jgi:hypothetical protein